MYRIALIGCGRIAPAHLTSLTNLPDRAQIVALCDTDDTLRRQRQQEYGVSRGFGTLQELVAWGAFDIAVVLTPPDVRASVCLPLFEAGKHVLVEKPFTLCMGEARTIVGAASSAGVTLAVSQNFRWFPPAPALRRGVLDGRIGRVLSLTRVDAGWRDEEAGWRNTTPHLALSVMGVHWLDQIRWVLGEEGKRVYASTLVSELLTSSGEDISATVITFCSGAVVTLVHHWAAHSRGVANGLQIEGTVGAAITRAGKLVWRDADGNETTEDIRAFSVPESIECSWVELLNALDEGREPCHSGRDNLRTVALLTGAYRSADTGQAVDLAQHLAGSA